MNDILEQVIEISKKTKNLNQIRNLIKRLVERL